MGPDAFTASSDKESRPSPIDIHVGGRIRLRRTLMGMSQERLGEALGLTFQQVQKYERGVNRVGASRLFDLSRVLDVSISFFFDDMPEPIAGLHGTHHTTRVAGGFAEAQDGFGADEALRLLRADSAIINPVEDNETLLGWPIAYAPADGDADDVPVRVGVGVSGRAIAEGHVVRDPDTGAMYVTRRGGAG